jgi:hypothetical protein
VAYNATAATPVVPLVLYLEDEPRTGLARDPGVLTPETVVPYVGSQTAGALQAGTTTWLQRAAVLYGQPCPGSADVPTPCQTAVDSVHELLSDGVVVAAPATEPSVNAPLGWTLSSDSRDRLDDAIDEQVDGRCTDSPRPAGYTCLAPLLDLLR